MAPRVVSGAGEDDEVFPVGARQRGAEQDHRDGVSDDEQDQRDADRCVLRHCVAEPRIGLSVAAEGERLRVRISDDGRGGAVTRHGSGLAGLADRVAALGGSLLVHSPAGAGTLVEAVLPCAS